MIDSPPLATSGQCVPAFIVVITRGRWHRGLPVAGARRHVRAGTDPDLAALLESTQRELLECARGIVAALASRGALRHDISGQAAADMLWLQIQPGNYRRLVEERGWSHHAFERWHAAAMTTALLEPPTAR